MSSKLTYLRYKLVSQQYTTCGNTLWRDNCGKWLPVAASGKSSALCTEGVIHFYDHPVLAVLFNPVHADIRNPRLLKIRTSRPVAHDGLKGGCKYACAVDELPVPALSRTQIVEFGIRVALHVYKEPSFSKWARRWLANEDRSAAAAAAAYADADFAAAAYASTRAAAAAAFAAYYAAFAAYYAARSAAAAAFAAFAAFAAYYAARAAADAASAAGAPGAIRIFKSVLKIMKLYKLAG